MAKGVDDVTSIDRIAAVLKEMGDADVICCQEIAQEFDSSGQATMDQVSALAAYFPEHAVFYGPAFDHTIDGKRRRFGNLMLTRLPVMSVTNHRLPQPADPETVNMPRQLMELLVEWDGQPYRIMSTHLEYFSTLQLNAQIDYLNNAYREFCARALAPGKAWEEGFYLAPLETLNTILCGDLNLTPSSDQYQQLVAQEQDRSMLDAWVVLNPEQPHPPTCGIFDYAQWPEGPHCRDYFLISPGLVGSIRELSVDTQTNASDHQPVKLLLN